MTAHSSTEWKPDHEELTDALVEELAECVKENREFNEEEGYEDMVGKFTPGAYNPMSFMDHCILNLGILLDEWEDAEIPEQAIRDWTAKAAREKEGKDRMVELFQRAIKKVRATE